ncbi:MBL fold metallo-hydrolase [Bacillus carboniphilus]|uniref:MBL fold metallo-hydrolase n=1 Tax=Bacillus carboniphilus TaxID=86663 RepID=A0ABP3G5Z9_9BACI
MQVIKKGSLYQLAFMPRFFPVNCYMVEEESSLTLVDTALPYSWTGILQVAEQIGKPITKIVLTHGHGDHVGSLDTLKEKLPSVETYISKRDARLLKGDRSLDPTEPETPIRGGVPKDVRTTPDFLLEDGDEVGSLVAISTPGHTPGSMSFIDKRTLALIAGDAFQTRGGMAVSGQIRPTFPFPAMATWNKEVAIESANKLLGFNPSLLAVGHGKMIDQPNHLIDRAIQEANEHVNK